VSSHPPSAEQPCERILVIDDDPEILATMQDVLELSGATVMTATCAREARGALDAGFDPNVALIDVRLGGGEGGEQLARQLRGDDRYSELPIVLMSADLRELRRLEDSADATLGKPFDVDDLYKVLAEMCS
jgi:CheY-like chemotaxis protein